MPARAEARGDGALRAGDVDLLVATSVIEVGIDIPNATVMVIEEADRYGISQLHQLRGRVGRGEHESCCMLFSSSESELAERRLEAVSTERDGFRLAEVDLLLRGEGDLLGTKQSGLPDFRIARLPEDLELLERARRSRSTYCAPTPSSRPGARAAARGARARFGAVERRADRGLVRGRCASSQGITQGPRLAAPRGTSTRPTADRVREAIFSILGPVDGEHVLDLYAGSGALGIEALSRGRPQRDLRGLGRARRCRRCGRISSWLGASGSGRRVVERAAPFLRNAAAAGERWDLVFCDPPYRLAHRLGGRTRSAATAGPGTGGKNRVRELASDNR